MKNKRFIISCFWLLFAFPLFSQFGILDVSFGNNGIATLETGDLEYGSAIASQQDNKLVVAGTSFNGTEADMLLMRLKEDGSLDSSFSFDGIVKKDFNGLWDRLYAVCIQPDGKILVAGTTEFNLMDKLVLMRYLPNGYPDLSFNGVGFIMYGEGYYNSSANAIALQNDGKIVIAGFHGHGTSDFNAITFRFNPNGTPDTSFSEDGKLEEKDFKHTRAYDVKLLPDGNIIVCATTGSSNYTYFTTLIKYKANGTKDSLFGDNGVLVLPDTFDIFSPPRIAIQDSNKILVARSMHDDFSISRYHAEYGMIDSSFGINGFSTFDINGIDVLRGLTLQDDGNIIMSGYSRSLPSANVDEDVICARLDKNGALDPTFGNNGLIVTDGGNETDDYAYGVCIQNDGKVALTGYSMNAAIFATTVLRYLSGLMVGTTSTLTKPVAGDVFPNPTNGSFTLTYSLANSQQTSLRIFDVTGYCVGHLRENQISGQGTHHELINTDSLTPGIYFVQLATINEGILVKKIIKE